MNVLIASATGLYLCPEQEWTLCKRWVAKSWTLWIQFHPKCLFLGLDLCLWCKDLVFPPPPPPKKKKTTLVELFRDIWFIRSHYFYRCISFFYNFAHKCFFLPVVSNVSSRVPNLTCSCLWQRVKKTWKDGCLCWRLLQKEKPYQKLSSIWRSRRKQSCARSQDQSVQRRERVLYLVSIGQKESDE